MKNAPIKKTAFTHKELALLAEVNIHISNAQHYTAFAVKSLAMAKRFMRQINNQK